MTVLCLAQCRRLKKMFESEELDPLTSEGEGAAAPAGADIQISRAGVTTSRVGYNRIIYNISSFRQILGFQISQICQIQADISRFGQIL